MPDSLPRVKISFTYSLTLEIPEDVAKSPILGDAVVDHLRMSGEEFWLDGDNATFETTTYELVRA